MHLKLEINLLDSLTKKCRKLMKTFSKILLLITSMLFLPEARSQNALDFDGVDDKVDCGNDTSVQINGKTITLEAWIYPTAWKTNAYDGNVICKEYNTSNYGYMLRVGAGGKLNFAIGDGSWHEITTANTILSLNTWQHIAGTYDGTKMRVYLNGSAVDSSSVSVSISSTPGVNLLIGAHSSYVRFYQGMIDEVRIWNICRSQSQLYNGMSSEICSKTNGLRAYYKFNQGKAGGNNLTVKTLSDFSGYNNKGTLTAFALSGSGSNWLTGKSLTKSVTNAKDTEVRCDRFYSPSGKYKWYSSGIYHDTIPTYYGCDSAITFYLTIKKSTTKTITAFACKSYVSPSGVYTWTQSGTYTDYLINSVKCDSIITIILHIGGSRDTIYPSACHNYKTPSGKKTYTLSGHYTDTLVNFRGCDSVIDIYLTMLQPTYSTISPKVCEFYTSPSGKYTYTQKGKYYDTIINSQGCDSIVTINLDIKRSSASIKKSVCYIWTSPSGKYTWTSSGTYHDTIINKAGCDSAITIDLTVNKASYHSISASSCRYYKSPSKKRVWSVSGQYKDTLTNYLGCDSVLNINLKIIKVNIAVVQNGPLLTAASTTGVYQWLNCTTFKSKINGETNRTFTATINGNYAVDVTDSGCRDTSSCYTITGVGISNLVLSYISIKPNPNHGGFAVSLPTECTNASLRVIDISGKVVFERSFASLMEADILLDQPPGTYLLQIESALFRGSQYIIINK